MVEQIQIKATVKRASLLEQILVGIIFLAPIGYFYYLWRSNQEFYFSDPPVNLFAHAMLIIIPIAWSSIFTAGKMTVDSPGEFLAYGDSKREWWTSIILYPSLILGVLFAGHFVWQLLSHPSSQPMTTVGEAVFTFILATLFAVGIKLKQKHRIKIWSNDEGLHFGMSRFIGWADIHHVRWLGRDVEVYHRNNQDVPAVIFSVQDDTPFKVLSEHLSKNGIVSSKVLSTKFILIQVTIAVLAIGVLAGGAMAHFLYGFNSREIVAYALGFGIFVMYQLEKIYVASSSKRGLPKINSGEISSQEKSPCSNEEAAEIQKWANKCIQVVSERFGMTLSFDQIEESAKILERVLKSELFNEAFVDDDRDDKGGCILAGAFLGELIRQNADAFWSLNVKENKIPRMIIRRPDGDMEIYPFHKVQKHRESGAEGELVFFILIATGRIDLNQLKKIPPEPAP